MYFVQIQQHFKNITMKTLGVTKAYMDNTFDARTSHVSVLLGRDTAPLLPPHKVSMMLTTKPRGVSPIKYQLHNSLLNPPEVTQYISRNLHLIEDPVTNNTPFRDASQNTFVRGSSDYHNVILPGQLLAIVIQGENTGYVASIRRKLNDNINNAAEERFDRTKLVISNMCKDPHINTVVFHFLNDFPISKAAIDNLSNPITANIINHSLNEMFQISENYTAKVGHLDPQVLAKASLHQIRYTPFMLKTNQQGVIVKVPTVNTALFEQKYYDAITSGTGQLVYVQCMLGLRDIEPL